MLYLFTNVYLPENERRRGEILTCLRRNATNPGIAAVIPFDGRPTFAQMFAFANRMTDGDDDAISVFTNADIYFEQTDQLARVGRNECYALTRYDLHKGKPLFHGSPLSQDVWVFRGRIRIPDGADFPMGRRGCDNRLAYELKSVGYDVTNPCLSIRTYHLHESAVRAADYQHQLVPGPYLPLPFEELP